MEHETDSEAALFDTSTNPSLKRALTPREQDASKRRADPKSRRKARKAELIPEEEQAAETA